MEVTPENPIERLFAVSTIIFALMVFSSFVGSITAAITQVVPANFDFLYK